MSSGTLIRAMVVGLVFGAALPTVSFAHQWHRQRVHRHHRPHSDHHDDRHHHGHRYRKPMAHHQVHGKLHFSHQHGQSKLHFRWSAPGAHFGIVWNVPAHRTHANENMYGARRRRYRVESHKVRQSFVTTDDRPGQQKGKRGHQTGFLRSTRVRRQR